MSQLCIVCFGEKNFLGLSITTTGIYRFSQISNLMIDIYSKLKNIKNIDRALYELLCIEKCEYNLEKKDEKEQNEVCLEVGDEKYLLKKQNFQGFSNFDKIAEYLMNLDFINKNCICCSDMSSIYMKLKKDEMEETYQNFSAYFNYQVKFPEEVNNMNSSIQSLNRTHLYSEGNPFYEPDFILCTFNFQELLTQPVNTIRDIYNFLILLTLKTPIPKEKSFQVAQIIENSLRQVN
jgi:hypothetical protein